MALAACLFLIAAIVGLHGWLFWMAWGDADLFPREVEEALAAIDEFNRLVGSNKNVEG